MLGICPKGKTKGFLSYKKDHGTNLLKNTLLMNISKFIGGGDFFFYKPWKFV
jgi:hypothetical protein